MELNETYFYTATILNWQHLLKRDDFKNIVTDSLHYLCRQQLAEVYAFVIMPNHIHLLWRMLSMNGKEMPHASFMKFTAHVFQKKMRSEQLALDSFLVQAPTRVYQFWQKDAKATHIYTPAVFQQKMDYIHNNPLQEHWNLCEKPEDYVYSSAAYYHSGNDRFGIITDYRG